MIYLDVYRRVYLYFKLDHPPNDACRSIKAIALCRKLGSERAFWFIQTLVKIMEPVVAFAKNQESE